MDTIVDKLKNCTIVEEIYLNEFYKYHTAVIFEKLDSNLWRVRYFAYVGYICEKCGLYKKACDCEEYEYLSTKDLANYIHKNKNDKYVVFTFF